MANIGDGSVLAYIFELRIIFDSGFDIVVYFLVRGFAILSEFGFVEVRNGFESRFRLFQLGLCGCRLLNIIHEVIAGGIRFLILFDQSKDVLEEVLQSDLQQLPVNFLEPEDERIAFLRFVPFSLEEQFEYFYLLAFLVHDGEGDESGFECVEDLALRILDVGIINLLEIEFSMINLDVIILEFTPPYAFIECVDSRDEVALAGFFAEVGTGKIGHSIVHEEGLEAAYGPLAQSGHA